MNPLILSLGTITALAVCGSSAAQQQPTKLPKAPVKGQPVKGQPIKTAAEPKLKRARQSQAKPGTSNRWFPVTTMDFGTFYGQGEGVGTFEFENPHDEEITWINLTPSCQCAKAIITVGDRKYRLTNKPKKVLVRLTQEAGRPEKAEPVKQIVIGPNEKGTVETRLDMRNITGPKRATLDIHSTDPTLPHTKLTFTARGAKLFAISPKEVNLNKMTWNESREFTVTVTSPMQEDWEIRSMDPAGEAFDVSWEKTNVGEQTAWTIKGKYGPVNGEVSGGGMLKFRTNIHGGASFNVRVLAFVQGPLEVKPGGFVTLGLIRKGRQMKKQIVFEPNDGVDLAATALEFQKMTLSPEFITATSRKDGNKLVVELAVSDKAPTGLVKGDLVVQLNHPLVKEKRIMFNGFVR